MTPDVWSDEYTERIEPPVNRGWLVDYFRGESDRLIAEWANQQMHVSPIIDIRGPFQVEWIA